MQTAENEQSLHRLLEQLRDARPLNENAIFRPDFVYGGIEDFVLQHGSWHRGDRLDPRYKGVQKACFGNALASAILRGYPYIEGFAMTPTGEPIHHAWNLTPEGELFDSTWLNTGVAYIGVEFSVGRADNAIWFDDSTVLNNRFDSKIYRNRWTGENFNLAWRVSKMRKYAMRRDAAFNRPRIS